MALAKGARLEHYEILAPLGAGGMGEVYRALDGKLRREIALKILPPKFAADPSRLARFEREAHLLAQLNHPNIAAIYGLEHADGIRFLVLELVEGPTLADRLKSGPVEVVEALGIAAQIAEALEAAHEKGVVHRDLKPGNVKITPAGKVKVLDFGLAKALGDAPDSHAEFGGTDASTVTLGETKTGVVMGTAAYMSPEQAEGKPTDKRSDIWSFGVVLYEALSGKRCFEGKTTSHVLVHILEQEPDWQALPASTPVGVRLLLERCLTKDPAERLRDIGDVRVHLRASEKEAKTASKSGRVAAIAEAAPSSAPTKETRGAKWIWPTAGGAFAIAALAFGFLYFRPKPAPAVPPMRFEIPSPGNARLSAALAVSPDGRNLAFLATGADNVTRLWIRSLENLESRPLQGTEGAGGFPFWSPDSRYIVFQTPGKLHTIEAAGGPPSPLCDLAFPLLGGFWTSDNKIIIGTNGGGVLLEVAGGQLKPFTTDDSKGHTDGFPSLLPDGRHFVYSRVATNSPENGGIYLGALDEKAEQRTGKRVLADIAPTVFAPSPDPALGYILFVRGANPSADSLGTLMAQPFDNRKLELTSDAVSIAEQVPLTGFSASATGVLVYGIGALITPLSGLFTNAVTGQLTWYDRKGNVLNTVGEPGSWRALALSPDNTKVAYERNPGRNMDIWVHEFARGAPSRLTSDPAADMYPVWNADGSRIAFFSARRQRGIYQRASNGAGGDELLVKVDHGQVFAPSAEGWSRDGRFMLMTSNPAAASSNLWVLPLTGTSAADRNIVPLVKSEFRERGGCFSPDNRWFAYTSDRSGKDEVYVRAFDPNFVPGSGNPSPGAEYAVSKGGGTSPHWSGDGKEIFYMAPDGGVMAVDVSDKIKPGIPKQLFKVPPVVVYWDVANDGQRFLIPVAGGTASGNPAPYKVVLNWTSLLKH